MATNENTNGLANPVDLTAQNNEESTNPVGQSQELAKTDKDESGGKKDNTDPQKDRSSSTVETESNAKSQNGPVKQRREIRDNARVEEGRNWNNRDRNSHNSHRKYSEKRSTHNKFDPASETKSNDPIAIRKQVEFYFSDSNLLTDKFLFEKVDGHKNVPVPIDIIHSFKRMRRFEPRSAVVEALKESKVLNIVEDDTAIQRKEPLPEGLIGKPMDEVTKVHETASMVRSVYVKGFGDEERQTQFDIEAFFANYGPTNSVRLRRQPDGLFKGSVFVEFDSEDTQKSFLALDPKPKWNGADLLIKSKKEYCEQKVDDIKAGKIDAKSYEPAYGKNKPRGFGRDNKRHDYQKGEDSRDWRERRDDDRRKEFGGKHQGRKSYRRSDKTSKESPDIKEENQEEQKETQTSTTTTEAVPLAADIVAENGEKPAETAKEVPTSEQVAGKKRAHEGDDDGAETQGKEKKVDSKDG